MNNFSLSEINIYPNPAKENITIETDPNETINAIALYDVTGKLLMQTSVPSNKAILNIRDLSKGCYFIKVQSRSSQYRSKIVIE